MAETSGKQVDWFIPRELLDRMRMLHGWAKEKNFLSVPPSERDFAILMLDDAVSRGENVKRAYEKDGNLIIDPFENARKRISVVR
jgi:hypothetical protein